jgi:hypothetical protein
MGKPSLGPAIPIPNGVEETPTAIDLSALQRRIMAQVQQYQGRLVELDQERHQLANQIVALRGQLDLIAELSRQGGAPA